MWNVKTSEIFMTSELQSSLLRRTRGRQYSEIFKNMTIINENLSGTNIERNSVSAHARSKNIALHVLFTSLAYFAKRVNKLTNFTCDEK